MPDDFLSISDDCLFCKIIDGKIPSEKLFEDDSFIAFKDINPQSKVHILIVPKRHIAKLSDCVDSDQKLLSGLLLTANKVAKDQDIAESGYRVVINSGEEGGQVVFHVHLHLMGGEKLGGKMG
jgi:histidine triad (HIT) family protein